MYSRPSTSTVDALKRVSSPNAPDIIGSSQVTQSANGRYLDFRNPGQLQQNAQARAAEVTNFVEGLTKVAKPLIDDALLKQAKTQVGELLATQDPVQLIRGATEEQRALVRSLSPQAQDILQDKAAQGSIRLYQESYSAERAKRAAVLQSTTATPEEKAKAESEAKTAALDFSGLTKVQPTYIATYGEQLAETDAALKGLDYKETLKNQTKEDRAKLGNSYRAMFGNITDMRLKTAGSGDVKANENFVIMLRDGMTNQIKRDSGAFTPQDQAEAMGEALQIEVARLAAAGDWERASQIVGSLEVMANTGADTGTGLDFYDQKLNNGFTLRYMISSASETVEKGYKNWQNEQAFESVRDLMPLALQGQDVMPELISRMGNMSAEQIMQIAPQLAQLKGIGNQASNEQIMREAELQYQLRGMKPDAAMNLLRGEVNAGRIKPGQFGDLVGRIGKDDPVLGLIDGQRSSLAGEIAQSGLAVARARGVTDRAGVEEEIRDLSNDVTKATEKRLAQMEAEGKPVDEAVVRSVFRNELEAAQNRRIKDRQQLEKLRAESGPRARVLNEVQQFQQNVQASNGNVTVMSFDKPVRVAFQRQFPNKPMTVDNLLRFQVDRLKALPADRDGKPAFEDPNQVLKDIIKRSKGQPVSVSNPAQRYFSNLTSAIDKGPIGALLRQIRPGAAEAAPAPVRTPAQGQPKPASGAVKPQVQAQAQSQQQIGARLVGAGLELVAGVITPPAAAATRTSQPEVKVAVENQSAVDTLMRLWRGQQKVDMKTPPLPQLSPQTPVQMVATAITNPMNPFFVAIGIAEGTRTAAGGYTKAYYGHRDPGSGAWNKGTVSGQNAPNAQLVDRQWMAKLTSVSTRVAPVLRSLGLAPGTQGYNRLMFNVLDLTVQAPAAAQDFIKKLPVVVRSGASIEAIAKARADSFVNPATGRLEAGGFGNSYSRLLADQRSRSGAFDYKRRI